MKEDKALGILHLWQKNNTQDLLKFKKIAQHALLQRPKDACSEVMLCVTMKTS